MGSVMRAATWTVGSRRRVRAVAYPAVRRTILVSAGDVVGSQRLRFPAHAIIRMEAWENGAWTTLGFPRPAHVTMSVVGLDDDAPTSTSVGAYRLRLPSHFDNGRVCLGATGAEWDAHERPTDEWACRAYWSTTYQATLMDDFDFRKDEEAQTGSLWLSGYAWTRRPGWLGWLRREAIGKDVYSPTLDDAACALANEGRVSSHWYRRLVTEHDA